MIAQLTGTLVSKKKNKIIVDIGGIGYELTVSLSTYSELPAENSKVKILTFQHIREDYVELFGFSTQLEKEFFKLLISVSGIGPKTAMEILSNTSLSGFKRAIVSGDLKTISNIKGIGKKTAEKLIFELKDKIREFNIPDQGIAISSSFSDEAIEALRAIGFTYFQSKEAVETALTRVSKDASTQQIIKEALKDLEKK
ncbi:MAG: Holliday junction DNA helicase RuvA [Elusimicrobia bacterium RIFOXYC2_FULL_34_12]|nr:MAG: Holliday junction DNA helicase RuvA [Elusimicrobia bacterium RIFOXYC2_FULL_34_12]OGS39071.1 MAG: Holliday junction DNA helicase RuvA [Elusimicrobia bacterium RIFOXYD2_FULL_34_30]HAM39212.1 Holliday junction branch migration protein RuvA [Elusimicrobiota bacterium]